MTARDSTGIPLEEGDRVEVAITSGASGKGGWVDATVVKIRESGSIGVELESGAYIELHGSKVHLLDRGGVV